MKRGLGSWCLLSSMSVTNDPGQTTWCLGACMYMGMRVSEIDKNMRVSE